MAGACFRVTRPFCCTTLGKLQPTQTTNRRDGCMYLFRTAGAERMTPYSRIASNVTAGSSSKNGSSKTLGTPSGTAPYRQKCEKNQTEAESSHSAWYAPSVASTTQRSFRSLTARSRSARRSHAQVGQIGIKTEGSFFAETGKSSLLDLIIAALA